MKKVYQTKFGHGGNCLQASVASILNLDLNKVPDFSCEDDEFGNCEDKFLNEDGYIKITVPIDWKEFPLRFSNDLICIGSFKRETKD